MAPAAAPSDRGGPAGVPWDPAGVPVEAPWVPGGPAQEPSDWTAAAGPESPSDPAPEPPLGPGPAGRAPCLPQARYLGRNPEAACLQQMGEGDQSDHNPATARS